LPHDRPPIRFIRRVWRSLVIQGGEIDRKAYELCVFFELRDRLHAGDIWVEGRRQYQDFESYLIPEPTFALLKAEGPLPVAIDTDAESYLAGRRAGLDREIEEVARLADQGKLDGVDLTGGELVISPVQASTPPEAEKVKEPPTRCCRPARSQGLPTICEWAFMARAGCVLPYGHDLAYAQSRVGWYAARILKGTAPADLPVEQSDAWKLTVNLQAAARLGLTIPYVIVGRADEVVD
jgi:hypothetical protein